MGTQRTKSSAHISSARASIGTALAGSKAGIESTTKPLPIFTVPEEAGFYQEYEWALNAFPTIGGVVEHLTTELDRLGKIPSGWRQDEVCNNIFLLSCTLSTAIDDYLVGTAYDFSRIQKALPPAAPVVRAAEKVLQIPNRLRSFRLSWLHVWNCVWGRAVTEFLQHSIATSAPESATTLHQRDLLAKHLLRNFPAALLKKRPKIPAYFRSRDFAPQDCLELAQRFVAAFPDRVRPIMVMGLRTAGSYLAPLTCAYLKNEGYTVLDWVTIRPKKEVTRWEKDALQRAAQKHARLLIVDESVQEGRTLLKTADLLRETGFSDNDVVALNPVDPAMPNWRTSRGVQALSRVSFIALEPYERYKQRLMESDGVVKQLREYFRARGYQSIEIKTSPESEKWNKEWRTRPPVKVDTRLKRILQVHLQDGAGTHEVRYVLAKSVGWAWMSYQAYFVAERLRGFVPPLLGLRDGILYTEWFPQSDDSRTLDAARKSLPENLGSYISARAKALRLADDPTRDLAAAGRHNGYQMLSYWLSRAYNTAVVRGAKLPRIQRELAAFRGPVPVLTDSKMSIEEWIRADSRILKTDFEHHSQGKNELLMTDPAYDLASAIFYFGLGDDEAGRLLNSYIKETGDHEVERRLFFNKLLVAFHARDEAGRGVGYPQLIHRRDELNRQFAEASKFLVAENVRECGKFCQKPREIRWHDRLIVSDIDGVIDKLTFGFPGTTAAGIQAISLLHAHGFALAFNTARNVEEVKLYCRAFGFAGGVAEYGSVVWDNLCGRERVLVSPESLQDLEKVRAALRQIPGVYLNDDYKYSLRAFMYDRNQTVPLPEQQIQDLLAHLGVTRVRAIRTSLDNAILANEVDKGAGMLAMLEFVGLPGIHVLAIGDSEPDLAMFRVAHRSFSPGHIGCRQEARALGCWISGRPLVAGLLEIAQVIVHPDGAVCDRCRMVAEAWPRNGGLFIELLEAADQKPLQTLVRNVWELSALEMFKK